jgi:hypothetical protein
VSSARMELPIDMLCRVVRTALLDPGNPTRAGLLRLDRSARDECEKHVVDAYLAAHPDADAAILASPMPSPRAIRCLLERGGIGFGAKQQALRRSVAAGDLASIDALLAPAPRSAGHVTARADEGDILVLATRCGHAGVVRALITCDASSHPARACDCDNLALMLATRCGHTDVVRELLDAPHHAAQADARDSWALCLAAQYGRVDIARMLLGAPHHPAQADADDSLALCHAVKRNDHEMVRVLIHAGAQLRM